MSDNGENMLCAYRGLADVGEGEGPGFPIARGEQFLTGTAPSFCKDSKLLSAIRPWLTLDSKPQDHGLAKLESWSCFCESGRLFVVRMVWAGHYDQRVAYFSHARSWPAELVLQDRDPGASLGRSEWFKNAGDSRDSDQAALLAQVPSLPDTYWMPCVKAKPEAAEEEKAAKAKAAEAAVNFLGHLLQALEQPEDSAPPLLVSVPLRTFEQGSPLFALIAYARAALPANLKAKCSIRIHTRQPENFALRLRARLIVLPEDAANDALRVHPGATLLDRQGERVYGQAPVNGPCFDYARAVTGLAFTGDKPAPQGLLPFSAFMGRPAVADLGKKLKLASAWAWPKSELSAFYLLTSSLAASDQAGLSFFFRKMMRERYPDYPWQNLLSKDEWLKFLADELGNFVLLPASKDEEKLQAAVASVLVLDGRRTSLDHLLAQPRQQLDKDVEIQGNELRHLLKISAKYPRLLTRPSLDDYLIAWLGPQALEHSGKLGAFQNQAVEALKTPSPSLNLDGVLGNWLAGLQPIDKADDRRKLDRVLQVWREHGLIGREAMRRYAGPALRELVLAEPETLADTPGLQAAAMQAMLDLGLTLDKALVGWFAGTPGQGKLRRLLELLRHSPRLFGSHKQLANLTVKIPLSEWRSTEESLTNLLTLELNCLDTHYKNTDGRRSAKELAGVVAEYCQLLVNATLENNNIDSDWADEFIAQVNSKNYQALQVFLNNILGDKALVRFSNDLVKNALDRLRQWIHNEGMVFSTRIGNPWFDKYCNYWLAQLQKSDEFDGSLEICLRLADLPVTVGSIVSYPMAESLFQLPAMFDAERQLWLERKLFDAAFDPQWHGLKPSLLTANGDLRLACSDADVAERLVSDKNLRERLNAKTLLALHKTASDWGLDLDKPVYKELTRRWKSSPKSVTKDLILADTWRYWLLNQHEVMEQDDLPQVAWQWMTSEVWNSQPKQCFECVEDWEMAIKYIQQAGGLAEDDVRHLFKDCRPRWPLLVCDFNDDPIQDQLTDLYTLVHDIESFGALVAEADKCDVLKSLNESAAKYSKSKYFPVLVRLSEINSTETGDKPIIVSKEEWRDLELLHKSIGNNSILFDKRRFSVLEYLYKNPNADLNVADIPNLWNDIKFIEDVLRWLQKNVESTHFVNTFANTLVSLDDKFKFIQSSIQYIQGNWSQLATWFWQKGYESIARFLHPNIEAEVKANHKARAKTQSAVGVQAHADARQSPTLIEPVPDYLATRLGSGITNGKQSSGFKSQSWSKHFDETVGSSGLQENSMEYRILLAIDQKQKLPECGVANIIKLAHLLLSMGKIKSLHPRWPEYFIDSLAMVETTAWQYHENCDRFFVFELLLSLGRWSMGDAAIYFIEHATKCWPEYIESNAFWSALLNSVCDGLHSGDDHPDWTIMRITEYANNKFSIRALQSLQTALKIRERIEAEYVHI